MASVEEKAAQTENILVFDNQICFPLYSAANAVVRAYRAPLEKLDLTYLQYMVMMILWETPQIGFKELCARMRLDSGTLTPVLKRLEAKGMVVRTRSDEDERVRLLALTEKGFALREPAQAVPWEVGCQLGLPPEKLIELKSLCEELLDAMTDE